jgi:hypothetical protein
VGSINLLHILVKIPNFIERYCVVYCNTIHFMLMFNSTTFRPHNLFFSVRFWEWKMIVSINIISLLFLRMEMLCVFFKVRCATSYVWFIVKRLLFFTSHELWHLSKALSHCLTGLAFSRWSICSLLPCTAIFVVSCPSKVLPRPQATSWGSCHRLRFTYCPQM